MKEVSDKIKDDDDKVRGIEEQIFCHIAHYTKIPNDEVPEAKRMQIIRDKKHGGSPQSFHMNLKHIGI